MNPARLNLARALLASRTPTSNTITVTVAAGSRRCLHIAQAPSTSLPPTDLEAAAELVHNVPDIGSKAVANTTPQQRK